MEEILLLLRIGFNLEVRRVSRASRSNLELPDVSIVKSEDITFLTLDCFSNSYYSFFLFKFFSVCG